MIQSERKVSMISPISSSPMNGGEKGMKPFSPDVELMFAYLSITVDFQNSSMPRIMGSCLSLWPIMHSSELWSESALLCAGQGIQAKAGRQEPAVPAYKIVKILLLLRPMGA